ncbi:MAG TPA: lysine--tRNA ligase [Verrucomicrobiae bacterium]|nr:lysine--tRNA ligase [Verrucomicrobiae bacterium]
MATLKDYRDERLRKLDELKQLGIDPYPARVKRTNELADIVAHFDELTGRPVTVVGRIQNIRKFGKIAFIVIRDVSGELQLFLRAEDMASFNAASGSLAIEQLPLLDAGDFVQASGVVEKTQTGEKSVTVHELRLLTKSLRPMPNKQDGFTNKEERFRRRYVDMNVNIDVRERFVRRSRFWQATRDFLTAEGFLEINIPVLENTAGGADANPFVTHMDALGQDFYLRISHELPLKRLLVAGFEKVFDIGARFRNENYSDEHLPEHIAMEWYWAYADWEEGMELTERMIRALVDYTWGKRVFTLASGDTVDFGRDEEHFPRISFVKILQEQYQIDVFNSPIEDIAARLKAEGLEVEKQDNRQRSLDKLWKKYRTTLAGPAFLVDMPTFMQPLAKVQPDNPRLTEQFNLVFGGSEMCKAFSELNDPLDQLRRFSEQQAMRDAGDDEAQMLDIDYVEALEYGMPPACGLGFSERIFWSLEGVTAREGVPFPQLRSEIDETTKAIYPELYTATPQVHGSRPQDFSRRIVTVVDKTLAPWRVVNAVAHMEAVIGNEVPKTQLTSGDYFVGNDELTIPRNSQYPIIIMRAEQRELHTLYDKVCRAGLKYHVFIKEMQDTNNDEEIVTALKSRSIADTTFYGISFFAPNEIADKFTKGLQLWK